MNRVEAARAAIEYSTEPRIAFFADPDVDRVLGITMAVAQEVAAVGEKLDSMERLLVDAGVLKAGALAAYVASPDVARQRLDVQEAFVARLLRVVEQELVALRGANAGAAASTGSGERSASAA
ncbi:MAG: hypothetical protein R3E65_11375 [Steroidobacteraceae bacterium]